VFVVDGIQNIPADGSQGAGVRLWANNALRLCYNIDLPTKTPSCTSSGCDAFSTVILPAAFTSFIQLSKTTPEAFRVVSCDSRNVARPAASYPLTFTPSSWFFFSNVASSFMVELATVCCPALR
jgi:hypothetical protein